MEERHCKGIWQWKKGNAKDCQVVTIVQLHIWKNDQQGVSKVSERCQQGVNKLSTRCQICNHLPMKNMQVILSVFVCRQKIIFVFVFAFVIFWMEGRGPKKNILWNFMNLSILWILWNFLKNGGGGEPKYEVLIIDNHCAPSHSEGVWKNQNWSIIKADNENKET